MKYCFALIFVLSVVKLSAQDTIITYFDGDWKEVKKEDAQYFRKLFKDDKGKWSVIDYYIDGKKQMTGTYRTKKLKKRQGYFVYYYENGSKKSEGNFVKDKYEGEWNWYFENGHKSAHEVYHKDELKDIEYWNNNGSKIEGEVKLIQNAQFIGGENALKNYISKSVRYPVDAQKNGIMGRVYISFIISKEGEVTNTKVERSIHSSLDKEGLRVINGMPNWIPARQHNLPIRMSFTIPINFVLE